MQTQKMSLANIQGKLSRSEMKNIMAGSGGGTCRSGACTVYNSANGQTYSGYCGLWVHTTGSSHCMCVTNLGHYTSTNGWAACTT